MTVAKEQSVYLIRCGELYKIGVSENPVRRMQAMQLPQRPELVASFVCEDPYGLERELHEIHSASRQYGEWFYFEGRELSALVRYMTNQ